MRAPEKAAAVLICLAALAASACNGGGAEPTPTPTAGVPQGRIVFTSDRDANVSAPVPEVYIMNADGSDQTNLSSNASFDWEPLWSPDGTRIAFIAKRDRNDGQSGFSAIF